MPAYTPDEMVVVKGFVVEITSPSGHGEVDTAWETCTGGGLNIEVADSSVGATSSIPPRQATSMLTRSPFVGR